MAYQSFPPNPSQPPNQGPQPAPNTLAARFSAWFRAQSGVSKVAWVAVALFLTSSACSLVYLGATNAFAQPTGNQANVIDTPTWTSIPLPTVTPIPTATPAPPGPPPPSGAVIGGPIGAFDNRYGAEVNSQSWNISIDGQPIQLKVVSAMYSHGDIFSADTQDRVWTVGLNYTNSSPGASVVLHDCARFLPLDAIHVKDIQQPSGPTLHIYRSASLASAFTAGSFVDGASQALPPGTFTVIITSYSCDVQIGE